MIWSFKVNNHATFVLTLVLYVFSFALSLRPECFCMRGERKEDKESKDRRVANELEGKAIENNDEESKEEILELLNKDTEEQNQNKLKEIMEDIKSNTKPISDEMKTFNDIRNLNWAWVFKNSKGKWT